MLELDDGCPSYGQLTLTSVRVSDNRTLSRAQVGSGFNKSGPRLLLRFFADQLLAFIDRKRKFHFFQQQLFLVYKASSSNVTWSSPKSSMDLWILLNGFKFTV